MIKVRRLEYAYPEDFHVFHDLSFEVGKGQFWGILGSNGSGKTTLMDIILGMKYPRRGDVEVDGVVVKDLQSGLENIVYLSQDISLKGDVTIRDFLDFNKFFYKNYSDSIEMELLDYFNVFDNHLIGALSTGQQKKVQIIVGLAANTDIILIDEITAVLDPETRAKFFKKLSEFNKEKQKTILLATNIHEDLKGRVDKILYIKEDSANVVEPDELERYFNV